jgi:hypothetical protein
MTMTTMKMTQFDGRSARFPWTALWVGMLCACGTQALEGGLLIEHADSGAAGKDAGLSGNVSPDGETDSSLAGGSGGAGGFLTGGAAGGSGGASGGAGGTASGGGPGGASCSSVTPCGGDVVGTWTVTSSCLNVSGQLDMSPLGLGCASAAVTGSLKVTGTWTARSDGTYSDNTTTTGDEVFSLPASCLNISGTTITCEGLASVFPILGYDSVSCTSATSGGCTCPATVKQTGWAGVVTFDASTSGKYATAGNVVTLDGEAKYSYCVSGSQMTWTPQSTSPTTTGTVVFQNGSTVGSGGSSGSGGANGKGGSNGSGGSTATTQLPCDIYADDGGPCVAAHSTVRALLAAYSGPLYQVKKADGTSKDIPVLGPGGFADSSVHDAFCGTDVCTISIIYDQSGRGNHLTKAPPGGAKPTPGSEADSKALPITLSGHQVYGEHNPLGVGYRNNTPNGTATGDNPETIYMIASGDYYNGACCFEYGNMETNSMDNGDGAMEAVYFGNCTIWGKGAGTGPWVMGALENGLWAGNTTAYEGNTSVTYKYVTAILKGDKPGLNHWAIKAGNAQSGSLTTMFDGTRPSARYNPMKKEGAIGLGISGDNSNGGQGNFFEGVMTAHFSSDAADDAVQANIVSVYGQ